MQSKILYAVCLLGMAGLTATLYGVVAKPAAQTANQAGQELKHAVAVVKATAGNKAQGKVQFSEMPDGKVKVMADLEGLAPNQQHGFHVHQFGDCSAADATSAGGHYNPANTAHALPPKMPRHAGDLGNVKADANGKAHYEMTVDTLSIAGAKAPIIGRAIIVHEKSDSGGQPTGDAGGRVGCGVIGVAKADG
jgi:Cu-Zn family superoxide dismutase